MIDATCPSTHAMTIRIPKLSLVVLVGPSGSGKSTFARTHFKPTEVVSSDACRAMLTDDETCLTVNAEAFALVHHIAGQRLALGKLTVIDATRVPPEVRERFVPELVAFLDGLVSHYVLDGGKRVVAHAGLKRQMHGRGSKAVRAFCLYGETTGESDEFGLPVRLNGAADYRGPAAVVYGHTPVPAPEWLNGTANVDTGCVVGEGAGVVEDAVRGGGCGRENGVAERGRITHTSDRTA